jgi:ubiquinone/menaquinone biosynthesis C-methylase UbiE
VLSIHQKQKTQNNMCQNCQKTKASIGQKFSAWTSSKSDKMQDKIFGSRKQELFKDLSGKVLEIGPGTGVNFDYFPRDIEWIGLEPSLAMQKYLKQKAQEKQIAAEFLSDGAEKIPLEDNSVDHVVCTLVLCSVSSQQAAINEIKRVLKPGGSFIFIEHVGSEKGTKSRKVQELARPLWNFLADGCDPARDTADSLKAAEFSDLSFQTFDQQGPFGIKVPHIYGFGIK